MRALLLLVLLLGVCDAHFGMSKYGKGRYGKYQPHGKKCGGRGKPPSPWGKPPSPWGKPPSPWGKPPSPWGKPPSPWGKPPSPWGKPPSPWGKPPSPWGKPPTPWGRPPPRPPVFPPSPPVFPPFPPSPPSPPVSPPFPPSPPVFPPFPPSPPVSPPFPPSPPVFPPFPPSPPVSPPFPPSPPVSPPFPPSPPVSPPFPPSPPVNPPTPTPPTFAPPPPGCYTTWVGGENGECVPPQPQQTTPEPEEVFIGDTVSDGVTESTAAWTNNIATTVQEGGQERLTIWGNLGGPSDVCDTSNAVQLGEVIVSSNGDVVDVTINMVDGMEMNRASIHVGNQPLPPATGGNPRSFGHQTDRAGTHSFQVTDKNGPIYVAMNAEVCPTNPTPPPTTPEPVFVGDHN